LPLLPLPGHSCITHSLLTYYFYFFKTYDNGTFEVQTLAAKTLTHDAVEHRAAVVTECKSFVIVFLKTVWNVDVEPLTRKRLLRQYKSQDNTFFHNMLIQRVISPLQKRAT